MSRHFPRRFAGLTIIQTMTLLAVLGLVLFAALSLFKKESAPAVSFKTINGEQIALESLRGKVVMVNFWATSCTTCVKEMPNMIEVYKEFAPEGLDFLAIAMSYDPPMYVMNFAKTRSLPFRVAMDSEGKAAKAFGKIELTPTTIVMNHEGKVLKTYVGEPDWNEFRSVIKAALTAKSAAKSAA